MNISELRNIEEMVFKKTSDLEISYHIYQGWIQHDLVGGGGCSASSGAKLCRSCVPPALNSLQQSLT